MGVDFGRSISSFCVCGIALQSLHLCRRIAFGVRLGRVRRPIGLRSVHDERVLGGIHQKCYFYSFFPIHLGSTMVPITRNG